jgi:diadenosine tetraphosphatase ApaH/serine/threonine PP2A family protein phosphatase
MRVAVLSDIHSNLMALDAVLRHAGAVDAIWHLGDIVGYGPEPDAVVARLAELQATGVRGNHDAAAIGGDEIEWFNADARAAAEWTAATIAPTTRRWLADLPIRRVADGMLLVHGSPRDPLREYVTDDRVAAANLEIQETDHAFHGHTHVPVAWLAMPEGVALMRTHQTDRLELGQARVLANPGSVGQPRDGDPRAAYLTLDTETRTVSWHRVAYDVEPVRRAIRAAGLPARLGDRLVVGV